MGRRVGTIAWSAYASRDFIARHKLDPREGSSFLAPGIPWVGMSYPIHTMSPTKWLEDNVPAANVVSKVSAVSAILAALRAGIGAGILPASWARRIRPRARGADAEGGFGLWLLTHPDLKKAARVPRLP